MIDTNIIHFIKSKNFSSEELERLYSINPWFIPSFIQESYHNIVLNSIKPIRYEHAITNMNIVFARNEKIPFGNLADILILLKYGHKVSILNQSGKPSEYEFLFQTGIADCLSITNRPIKDGDLYVLDPSSPLQTYLPQSKCYSRTDSPVTAIINGNESLASLERLANDVLMYFGRSHYSIKKIYIPITFNLDKLFEAFHSFSFIMDHHVYMNRFQYQYSCYLLDSVKFLTNNFIMLKEDNGDYPPIGVVYFERYEREQQLMEQLQSNIVFSDNAWFPNSHDFGQATNLSSIPDNRLIEKINPKVNE